MIEQTELPKRRGRPPKVREPQIGDMSYQLQHWATRLEAACRLKAGAVDSMSKVDDIERERNAIVMAVALEMRGQ
jgi:hypothetical protein